MMTKSLGLDWWLAYYGSWSFSAILAEPHRLANIHPPIGEQELLDRLTALRKIHDRLISEVNRIM